MRQQLALVFTTAGFGVVDVADYTKSLQKLRESKVDFVVMDSCLPDWDGFSACSELRRRFNVPVIILGQESDDQVWTKILDCGANYYEIKPCKYRVLVAKARAMLRRYKLPEA